ncbi:MAG: histidine phosphatase family protein [Clostridium sp.]|nr:histidine phosphatase family protein [Clostridium sp.]MCM1444743.1 histidine phosphatase family protein [Candidatus Amulumruptor caecigallinarius]
MNKVYVLRHGETVQNKSEIMQGHMDTILDEKGINQAKVAKQTIDKIGIDLIISSPLKRTLETALIASGGHIPIIKDYRLISRNHGEFQGLSRSEINLKEYWNLKINKQYQKAESVGDLYNRIDNVIKDVKTKYKDKKVLLVTHSGICRILYYYFNGIPEDGDLTEYESTTCSVEEYSLEDIK